MGDDEEEGLRVLSPPCHTVATMVPLVSVTSTTMSGAPYVNANAGDGNGEASPVADEEAPPVADGVAIEIPVANTIEVVEVNIFQVSGFLFGFVVPVHCLCLQMSGAKTKRIPTARKSSQRGCFTWE